MHSVQLPLLIFGTLQLTVKFTVDFPDRYLNEFLENKIIIILYGKNKIYINNFIYFNKQ